MQIVSAQTCTDMSADEKYMYTGKQSIQLRSTAYPFFRL